MKKLIGRKGGFMVLLATLIFTAVFLITLFIVGPFVGGAQMEIEVMSEDPARFSIEKNTLLRTNETKRKLMAFGEGDGSVDESIAKTSDKFGEADSGSHILLFQFEGDDDIERVGFLCLDDCGHISGYDEEFKAILQNSKVIAPRPIMLPEGGMGSSYSIYYDPDEVASDIMDGVMY